jgi:hypothetical protein
MEGVMQNSFSAHVGVAGLAVATTIAAMGFATLVASADVPVDPARLVRANLGACEGDSEFEPRADINGDGCVNVLDLRALDVGLSSGAPGGGLAGPSEVIATDLPILGLETGETEALLFLLQGNVTPLFGYSLEIEIVPIDDATGTVDVCVVQTNFFDERNLIIAGGAPLDEDFALIFGTPEGGVFINANTADGSTVLAVPDVNDVLAEVHFTAGTDASGEFEIVLAAATALSDVDGFEVPYTASLATVNVGGLADPDLNDDGDVNGADLGLLLGQWGPCDGACADLNGDDEVNGADLGILLGSWGPFPGSCG